MSDALRKIEKKHRPVKYSYVDHSFCVVCNNQPSPCDVVKLVRALDDILYDFRGLPDDRKLNSVLDGERVLEEVARGH